MVDVKIVKSKKDQKTFLKLVDIIYKEENIYIPKYLKVEKYLFSHKKNPNLNSNEIVGMIAYQEKKPVGRILGCINRIEMANKKIVRISHFDFINDSEVSFALLNAMKNWAKTNNAEMIVGELGFNDLLQTGTVIKNNLSTLSTIQQKYNYDYYIEHYKNFGFETIKKLNEYQLVLKDDIDTKTIKEDLEKEIADNKLKRVEAFKKYKIAFYGRKIFDLLYDNSISGFPTVIDEKVYNDYFKIINSLYDDEDLEILVNENDDVVGCMLISQNTSLALQTTCGRVLASKRMYTIGGEFKNEYDINFLISDKKYKSQVSSIFSKILSIKAKTKNYFAVYSNVWLNDDTKKQAFSNEFDFHLIRTRGIFEYRLQPKLIIKKDVKSLIGRPKRGFKQKLS